MDYTITIPDKIAKILELFATQVSDKVLDKNGAPTGALTGKYIDLTGKVSVKLLIQANCLEIAAAAINRPEIQTMFATALPNDPIINATNALLIAQNSLDVAKNIFIPVKG